MYVWMRHTSSGLDFAFSRPYKQNFKGSLRLYLYGAYCVRAISEVLVCIRVLYVLYIINPANSTPRLHISDAREAVRSLMLRSGETTLESELIVYLAPSVSECWVH